MINPRTSTELWDDDDELEGPLHYPNATRRRALIAHSLGVVGVLGTLALGIVAIVPHLSWVTHRAHALFAPEHPATDNARLVPQLAPPSTTPATPLAAAETAMPQPEVAVPQPPAAPVTPSEQLEPPSSAAVSPPAATDTAPPAPLATSADTPSAASTESGTTPAPAEMSAVTPPAAESKPPTPAATPDKTTRSMASAGRARTEPRLTWAEIERRKARYEEWLKSQGLEPVH